MSEVAKEIQKGERESEMAALQSKIANLLASADKKEEGAKQMLTMAIVSLVMSVVAAAVSIAGAGINAKGVAAGTKATNALGKGATQQSLDRAFNMATKNTTLLSKIMDGVAEGIKASGQFSTTYGQAQSQMAQADADRLQADAEKDGSEMQKAQQLQQDMKELLNKMVEMLQSFFAAQDKIANAASH
jgi:hypothetical protein